MGKLGRAKIAVIGGSGLERLFEGGEKVRVGTPYGVPPQITIKEIHGKKVAFLPRHGVTHSIPPHKVNYRANLWALREVGAERIISTNAVGAINERYKPGDFLVPSDLIDFTKSRPQTFYEEGKVVHVDCSQLYCPELREIILGSGGKVGAKIFDGGVLACTEGPRFETPAEIKMMKILGCDAVGMTGAPEAFLAKELGACYAPLCLVSNMAAGIQQRLTAVEVVKAAEKALPLMKAILEEAIREAREERSCKCAKALEGAEM